MRPVYREIKEELKSLAKSIRERKDERNNLFREGKTSSACVIQYKHLPELKYEFRHKHIARCEMIGTKREQIEQPAENNTPNQTYITQIKEEWTKRIEKAICVDQNRLVA